MANKIVPLDFSREEVDEQIQLGERDAIDYITEYKANMKKEPRVQATKGDRSHCHPKKSYYSEAR